MTSILRDHRDRIETFGLKHLGLKRSSNFRPPFHYLGHLIEIHLCDLSKGMEILKGTVGQFYKELNISFIYWDAWTTNLNYLWILTEDSARNVEIRARQNHSLWWTKRVRHIFLESFDLILGQNVKNSNSCSMIFQ